jgi:hypothetical protein
VKRALLIFVSVFLAVHAGLGCSVVVIPPQVARSFTVELTYAGKPLEMPITVSDARTGSVVAHIATDAKGHGVHELEPGMYDIVSPVSNDAVEVVAKGGVDRVRVSARYDHAPIDVTQVSATITDVSGAVISKAVVVLEALSESRTPVAAGTTDVLGSISLQAPDGEYLLRVARQGFHTAVVPLRVTKAGWSAFELALPIANCGDSPVAVTIKPKK